MLQSRVFMTGCGGMLGSAVYPYFASRYRHVLATDKTVSDNWLTDLDVRDHERLRAIFADFRPDLVIHLAAETELEYCETHADVANATNTVATRVIAELAEEYGATLVYVSTAGVFDGKKEGLYTEDDTPNPIMVYGMTKFMGEIEARKWCSRCFVVRAGWMMGGGRTKEKKFIYKILKQIGENCREIFAVNDLWGTPTYTYDFAFNLFSLLETRSYGTYHMVCEGMGTRFDVAREILSVCRRGDIKLTPVGSSFFKKEYFVERPRSEMMTNHNLRKLGIHFMRDWRVSLRDYIENFFPDFIDAVGEERAVARNA